MTMMRKCEGCNKPIPQRQFVEVSIRILQSNQGENQDAIEEWHGDYCDRCVATGEAVRNLVGCLTKYKGLESNKKNK